MRVEAIDVAFAQVMRAPPRAHHFRDGSGRAGRMRDPDRFRDPEPTQSFRFAEEWKAVGAEGEHAVDRAGDAYAGQRGNQIDGCLPGRRERFGVERVRGRHIIGLAVRPDRSRIDDHRLMTVTTDRVVIAPLAKIEILVLMSQDRLRDLNSDAGKLGEGRRPGELMLNGDQRDRDSGQAAEIRAPDAAASQDAIGRDSPVARRHARDPPPLGLNAGDPGVWKKRRAGRRARQLLGGPDRLGDAVGRDVIGPEDLRLVEKAELRLRPGRVEEVRRHAPTLRPAELPVQVGPSGGRGGHFQTAHAIPAGLSIVLERGVAGHRLLRERCHRLRGVGLEDDPRRV